MKSLFSSLRFRLVATVFVATLPALLLLPFTDAQWVGFAVGFLALCAAWLGGERFVLRQVRLLLETARRFSTGDLQSRTGLADERSELGQLARAFDTMAESLAQQIEQRKEAERRQATRAQQQTAVAALGQLALVTAEFQDLLDHTARFVADLLEVEFSAVLELAPDDARLWLRAGHGWRGGCVGQASEPATADYQAGFTLRHGEPTVLADLRAEPRFQTPELLREHGVVSSVTVPIRLQNGSYGVLGAHATRPRAFTEDEIHYLLALAALLTVAFERKRAEAALQQLADFAQHNPNAALELAEDGSITYCNETAQRLAQSVQRSHPRELLPPNVRELVRGCLETRQSRLRHQTEVAGRAFSWSFHPVAQAPVVQCYVEDITDRLNLEAQLRQSQKIQSVGQLAAGIAHDFNNLLTIIQGHAGILMARADLPPKLVESAHAVSGAAERAAGLTRQLLIFSRKNLIQPRPLDLRDVVGNLSKMLQSLLGETIPLQFQAPTDLPLVQADVGMLEQVLLNLAVNARDAMPKGGKLTITLAPLEVDDAYVTSHPQARRGRFVRLRVTDSGCGMDAATLNRIFEPFFTTKEPGKGTGLGLATVYGIVAQHGGWIEVTSTVGQGSAFSVHLPVSTETAPAAAPTARPPAPAARGGKENLLIVEDEAILRELVTALLQGFGYRTLVAANGRAALELWRQEGGAVDLLLTDMVLPEGVSGLELAGTLRAEKPALKILFTSGYGVDDLGNDTIQRLKARFLQKPYSSDTLVRSIRECLDG